MAYMVRNTDLILSQQRKQQHIQWKQALDLLYDVGIFLLSVADVVSDLMVTIQWYQGGNTIFFAIATTIICIATIAYAALFTLIYADHQSERFRIKCFLCILPFGQLVPLFIWLQSYQFEWINNLLVKCYLQPEGRASSASADPLKNYIAQKLKTHGGFLVESIVEAVPMSILQMIFLVTTDGITGLYLFSVIISMISVASKGLLIAYSIDRPTFIFNFGCFVADVFNVFVTVAWLFYNNGSGDNTYNLFLFSQPVNTLNAVWFYKEIILILAFAALALLALVAFAFRIHDDYNTGTFRKKVKIICYGILFIAFMTSLFPCFMIVIEALKFSVFPLLICRSIGDNKHARNAHFYDQLFTWVNGGKGKNEFLRRSRLVNQHLATTWLKRNPPSPADGLEKMRHNACARRLQNISESEYSLATVREAAGYTWKNVAHVYTSMVQEEVKEYSSEGVGLRWSLRLEIATHAMIIYFVLPIVLISAIFSIIYPVVIFIYTYTTTNATIGSLQLLLSYIYFGTLFILLSLSPWVYRFKRATMHLIFYTMYSVLDDGWLDEIIYAYQYEKNVAHVRNTLDNDIKMIPDLVEICMSYVPNASQQKQDDVLDNRVPEAQRALEAEIAHAAASIVNKANVITDERHLHLDHITSATDTTESHSRSKSSSTSTPRARISECETAIMESSTISPFETTPTSLDVDGTSAVNIVSTHATCTVDSDHIIPHMFNNSSRTINMHTYMADHVHAITSPITSSSTTCHSVPVSSASHVITIDVEQPHSQQECVEIVIDPSTSTSTS